MWRQTRFQSIGARIAANSRDGCTISLTKIAERSDHLSDNGTAVQLSLVELFCHQHTVSTPPTER